jgi:hypothetical protein
MPDPTASDAAQAADADTTTAAASQADNADDYDKDRAMALIRMQREERKVLAKKLADLETEKAQREEAERKQAENEAKQRGEFEKLAEAEKARAQKLETELQAEREARKADRVRHEVITAAQRLGAANPSVTYRLLDLTQVEYGDDGAPKNIDALLEALFKAEPYLKAQQASGQNGSTVPATPRAEGVAALSQQELDDHRKRTERSYALRF